MQVWGSSLLPAPTHDHERFHLQLAFLLLAVGGLAFVQGYMRHRKSLPLMLGIFGTALLFVGACPIGLSESQEHFVTIIGSLILISAHLKNRRVHAHGLLEECVNH
jgi:hypothetical protein